MTKQTQQEDGRRLHLIVGDRVDMSQWKRLAVHDENFTQPIGLDRRSALKLMGASAALALGVPGCKRKPERQIVSRHSGPEYQKPGKVLAYSSTWTEGNFPYGMIVNVVDGRPVKIEGNPDHPVNGTATNGAMQASILSLYDPARMQAPVKGAQPVEWGLVDNEIISALDAAQSVALLTRATLGPAQRELVKQFVAAKPGAKHLVYESVHDGPRRSAWKKIFGQDGELVPDYAKAQVILSLGCDFLGTEPTAVQATGEFAQGRNVVAQGPNARINRLYVAEAAMTTTGSNADHRLRIKPSALPGLITALSDAVAGDNEPLKAVAAEQHLDAALLKALAGDLVGHQGQSVIVADGQLPEAVHAAVALLNDTLGNIGKTLTWNSQPAALAVNTQEEIAATLDGGVDVLICLGVNPVYDWAGGGFETILKKARLSIGHGLYANETVTACTIGLPSCHNLESWNDAVAAAGVESICQPVIAPLYKSRQEEASLLVWAKALAKNDKVLAVKDWHDFVMKQWGNRHYPDALKPRGAWQDSLRKGVMVFDAKSGQAKLDKNAAVSLAAQTSVQPGGFELVILPDAKIFDGRFADSSWLQETPDPVTRLVWDNAAMLSPKTALSLGVSEGKLDVGDVVGDMIDVKVSTATVTLPILIVPGMADDVVATTTGYGRRAGGAVAGNEKPVGTSVAALAGSGRYTGGVSVTKAAGRYPLVRTQKMFDMHHREIAIDGTLAEYRRQPDFVSQRRHLPEQVDIYDKEHDYSSGYQWAMTIDMNKCSGCHACVTACQAENNIPVVGKEECANGREMHWMRIDRYHSGNDDNLTVHQQPMLCQHCENAPCENVCPVNATTHSPEGLNEMTYNRCIGTRYCANNCPYKVRRFNFFDYQKRQISSSKQELMFNPQVTVRSVGVMEKCTFCVQRINAAKYTARNKKEALVDGSLQTACQQVCPARAISFGDKNDSQSQVARQIKSPLNYFVLEELNVKARVSYLAKIRNPHPQVAGSEPKGHGEGHGENSDNHQGDHG